MNLGTHAINPAPIIAGFQADKAQKQEKAFMESEKVHSFDQTELFVRLMQQTEQAPWILIVHGYAEHGGRYGHVMEALYAHGFSVAAMDLRGHGYSTGQRGYVEHFEDYVHDLSSVVTHLKKKHKVRGLSLLGHSMGGLVATLYASRSEKELKALILSAPLYAIGVKVPAWKNILGHLTSRVWPRLSMPGEIDPTFLSHDPHMVRLHNEDPLNFEIATARWFIEVLRVTATIEKALPHIHLPVLLQLPTDDHIIDYSKAYRSYDLFASRHKSRLIYEGFYHEIYNELERKRPISELVNWCDVMLREVHVA